MPTLAPEDIDTVLPQTQCGLCGHGGCMPYAEALVFDHADINLCPPGGIPVLHKIGALLGKDPAPHEADMREKAKPKVVAVIRENECIGCTKCIQACPVDAILGSAKAMHTVISNECTGCELCVAPCPVDCIDLIEIAPAHLDASVMPNMQQANYYRERFAAREKRIAEEKKQQQKKQQDRTMMEKKNYIQAALERASAKKK